MTKAPSVDFLFVFSCRFAFRPASGHEGSREEPAQPLATHPRSRESRAEAPLHDRPGRSAKGSHGGGSNGSGGTDRSHSPPSDRGALVPGPSRRGRARSDRAERRAGRERGRGGLVDRAGRVDGRLFRTGTRPDRRAYSFASARARPARGASTSEL